jgi:peptidoglycan/LPS O-acetylase OafA/YrhL
MLIYHYRARAARTSDFGLSLLQLIGVVWAGLALAFPVSDPLIVPAFALIVFATWPDRGLVARLLSARPFQRLGDISYSVYLMHVPLGVALWFLWSHVEYRMGLAPALGRAVWLGLVFAAVLGVSELTYRRIEVPARRGLLRWSGRRKPPAGEAAIAAP